MTGSGVMVMLDREKWGALARTLDWRYSYVSETELFPPAMSGTPWLSREEWKEWEEPFKTTYAEYVMLQHRKTEAVTAIREAVGHRNDFGRHDRRWLSAVKLHASTLALAEFTAVIANLRAARFGRTSAWRNTALFGALDELRHTQVPLSVLHDLVQWDEQFDWTHRLFHTDDWVAIAGRHLVDELILTANPIEFAIGTNFVFETGFTNLQFVGLTSAARAVGDRMFEKMLQSIQTDEARHSQIGGPVLHVVLKHDPKYAQYLVDKWFWRSWSFFAIVTGFAMDYLTPVEHRGQSFKEFVTEWVFGQFEQSLASLGLERPWYWNRLAERLDYFHHMVYAAAYTHRATVWFDMAVPGPKDRAWLASKYPQSWPELSPIWDRVTERWQQAGPGVEWFTHGVTPVGFCRLCQLVLCCGTPRRNEARVIERDGKKRIFCSEECAWIFEHEPERYEAHEDVVARILAGKAPANLLELLRNTFGLRQDIWGKDVARGDYDWLAAARGGK